MQDPTASDGAVISGRVLRAAGACLVAAGLLPAIHCGPAAPELSDPADVRHEQRSIEGQRWHWVEAGAGPALVMLHGLPESWHGWHRVIPLLAGEYRVIAPDLEGFGGSELSGGPHGFCDVAGRLAVLLDEVAPGGYVLVGQDWGALVGACLAAVRPESVHAYVHVAAPLEHYDLTRMPDYRDFHLTPEAIGGLVRNVELFVTRVYDAGIHGGSEALPPGVLERRVYDFRGHQGTLTRYFADLELNRAWQLQGESRPRWEEIDVPVTIVIGDRDLLVPQELFRDAAARVPGFRAVVVIDGAAHFPAEEQPEALAAVLREAFGQ